MISLGCTLCVDPGMRYLLDTRTLPLQVPCHSPPPSASPWMATDGPGQPSPAWATATSPAGPAGASTSVATRASLALRRSRKAQRASFHRHACASTLGRWTRASDHRGDAQWISPSTGGRWPPNPAPRSSRRRALPASTSRPSARTTGSSRSPPAACASSRSRAPAPRSSPATASSRRAWPSPPRPTPWPSRGACCSICCSATTRTTASSATRPGAAACRRWPTATMSPPPPTSGRCASTRPDVGGGGDIVAVGHLLQAATPGLVADDAVVLVVAEQQIEQHAPLLGQGVGLGGDGHALLDDAVAGDDRGAGALDLDEAQAAGGERLEPVVLAEGRDVDAGSARRLEDRGAGFGGHLPPVDGEIHCASPR